MAAPIKASEITWHAPVRVEFGFTGLTPDQAVPIIRRLLEEQWPKVRRREQCAYVVRIRGDVAIAYGKSHSPVVYIGEGSAFWRLYNHAKWIASLLVAVPQLDIEVHIAEVVRKNNKGLYRYFEADMIAWFRKKHGCLPWFNRQSEKSKEGVYLYQPAAEKLLRKNLQAGTGNRFLWSIRPTKNNEQYEPYSCG